MTVNFQNLFNALNEGKYIDSKLNVVEKPTFLGRVWYAINRLVGRDTLASYRIDAVAKKILELIENITSTKDLNQANLVLMIFEQKTKNSGTKKTIIEARKDIKLGLNFVQKQVDDKKNNIISFARIISCSDSIQDIEKKLSELEKMMEGMNDKILLNSVMKILAPALEKCRESDEKEEVKIFPLFGEEDEKEEEIENQKKLEIEKDLEKNKYDQKFVEEKFSKLKGLNKEPYNCPNGISIEEAKQKFAKKEQPKNQNTIGTGLFGGAFIEGWL